MRGWLALALRLILLWRVALVGGRKAKGMQRILPWKKRRMDRWNQNKKVSGERERHRTETRREKVRQTKREREEEQKRETQRNKNTDRQTDR